jgi:DNA-binding NtrC family response regulator/GAF domain-containing protein
MSAVLLAVTGRATGIRYELDRDHTEIGRSSSVHIQLFDAQVSRRHAAIERDGDGWLLRDLSENGTALNGRTITGTSARLAPNDLIGVGQTSFLFSPELDYLISRTGPDVIIASAEPVGERALDVSGEEREAGTELLELVARSLAQPEGAKDLLAEAVALLAARFGAERAFVLAAVLGAEEKPRVLAAHGQGPITVSRTIVERVLREKRALISGDAPRDVAFSGGVSIVSSDIRSLLAAPLLADGRAIGMVHLDKKAKNAFSAEDLRAFIPAVNALALVVLAGDGIDKLRKRARRAHKVEKPQVIAESEAMKVIVEETLRASRAPSSVLYTGETGSGKEVLARLLHAESARRSGPFIAVNCGALPANLQESELFGHEKGAFTGADRQKMGLFEAANGGTLFLDEVGECARDTQVKLLRALQERVIFRVGSTRGLEVDVRIVAATSRRLEEMIARGEFREDLYYRLAVIHLRVPPLRSRSGDIAALTLAFVKELSKSAGVPVKEIDGAAIEALERRSWPGNVRELRNVIERAVIMSEGSRIGLGDLPADLLAGSDVAKTAIASGDTLAEAVARVEREMILRAWVRTAGVKSAVADALGISRVTLDAKLKLHGLQDELAAAKRSK